MSTLARNRKARHEFQILEKHEAGVSLRGTEVKSCRAQDVSLDQAYARVTDSELYLVGAHIAPYEQGNSNNHEPRRQRKLLMHRREIQHLAQAVEAKGLTVVPLRVYLARGRIKVELGLCRGKNVHDKRQTLKKRAYELEARRAVARR